MKRSFGLSSFATQRRILGSPSTFSRASLTPPVSTSRCFSSSSYRLQDDFTNQLPSLEEQNYLKLDARRKKLLFRSRERGMLETDLLLGTFAIKHLHVLNEQQLQQFEALLDAIDPDIYQWITKKVEVPPEYDNEIMKMVQEHLHTNPLGYVSTYAQQLPK